LSFLRAAVTQVVKLFVTDWTQTAGIAVILLAGFLLARQLHSAAVGFAIAAVLALHLVYTTASEARRRNRG
jgi:hypothetical protein